MCVSSSVRRLRRSERRDAAAGRLLARLGSDESGASLVEFALLAPFLGLLMVGIADYGRGFSERFALESAAHRTLERAAVGSTQPDYSFLKEEAAAAGAVPIENVTFENWLECDGTKMPSYDSVCLEEQQVARYLYVKIEKDFVPNFRWTGGDQPIRISGDAAVRVQ